MARSLRCWQGFYGVVFAIFLATYGHFGTGVALLYGGYLCKMAISLADICSIAVALCGADLLVGDGTYQRLS